MDNLVELFVNKQLYTGWLNVSVKRSIKAVSGAFDLSVTNSWTPDKKAWFISPLDECELKIDGEPVITGLVDKINSSFDASTRTISISGRDKTADLVDCSYVGPAEINGLTFLEFVKAVVKPFGIEVIAEVSTGSDRTTFSAQQGEKAFNFIERIARLRGLMLTTDTFGRLIISDIGTKRTDTALIEGKNIVSASFEFDAVERFGKYIVKGQKKGNDDEDGDTVAGVKGEATDPTITRYRPLIIIAEGAITTQLAKDRAEWEAITRAAKASRISAKVKGWRQGDDSLWKVNHIVNFQSQYFNMNQDWLISDVEYVKGNDGTYCNLNLEKQDAYMKDTDTRKKKKKGGDPWKELNDVKAFR